MIPKEEEKFIELFDNYKMDEIFCRNHLFGGFYGMQFAKCKPEKISDCDYCSKHRCNYYDLLGSRFLPFPILLYRNPKTFAVSVVKKFKDDEEMKKVFNGKSLSMRGYYYADFAFALAYFKDHPDMCPDEFNPNVSRTSIAKQTCSCKKYFPSQSAMKQHKRICHPRRRE